MTEELKPCPFCGEKPKYERSCPAYAREDITWWVSCINPGCYLKPKTTSFYTKTKAKDVWNERKGEAE